MKRRELLRFLGLAALGVTVGPSSAVLAAINCTPYDERAIQRCEAGIQSSMLDVVAAGVGGQHLNQWCWAACIEMIFRYYGFFMPQEEIVRQTWGSIVNLPANVHQMVANLNRTWIDHKGQQFVILGDVLTANVGTATQDLADNQPLIIGTMGHAMVLTSLLYERNVWGQGNVIAATVRDPWPGKGRRVLTAQEWYSTQFFIRIRVMRVERRPR
jgi:hypothetical protein